MGIRFLGIISLYYFACKLSGVQNLDNCIDDHIPLYLATSGGLALAAVLSICFMVCFTDGSSCFNFNAGLGVLLLIAHFGVQCWGSVIVFRKWELWKYRNFDCDKTTYLLSFSTLIIYWVLGLCGCKAAKGSD